MNYRRLKSVGAFFRRAILDVHALRRLRAETDSVLNEPPDQKITGIFVVLRAPHILYNSIHRGTIIIKSSSFNSLVFSYIIMCIVRINNGQQIALL